MNEELRVPKVFRASLDHLDLQAQAAPKDSVVCLDRKEVRVTLECLVHLESKVLRVWLVSWELKDSVVQLETEERLALWDLLDDLELLVPLVILVMPVCKVALETQVSKEPPEIKDALVFLDLLDNLVPPDLKDQRERVVLKDALDLLDSLDPQVLLVNVDFLVFLGHQAPLDNVVLWVLLANLVWKENVVQKDLQVPMVLLDPQDHSDLKVIVVCPELMASVVPLVFLVALVIKDPQDLPALLAALDLVDFPAHQDLLVLLDLQVREATEVRWDPKVWKVLLVHVVNLVHLEYRERRETLANLDPKEPRDTEDLWVYKVYLVHRVQEVIKVFPVFLVPPVLAVSLVPRDLQDVMEALVYKVLWVPQVPVVPVVRKVNLVHLVLLVLLDHQALLASLWDTMLRRWLPFLAKASPRAPTHYKETTLNYLPDFLERRSPMTNAEILSPRLMNSSRPHSKSSLNLREPRILLLRPARTLHMLIQNYLVVSIGSTLMKVTSRMPL